MSDKVDYEEKIVAYFDILGFKEKIKEKSAEEIHDILQWPNDYLEKAKHDDNDFYKNIECDYFSDSIVVSVVPKPEELITPKLLVHILEIIIGWINMGVICRGGIIRGKIFHKRGEIFGEALIDAVKLEKEAKYPRVLVKESVFNSARNGKRVDGAKKKENDYINSFLKPFADGIYFLDYFSPIMFRNISYISEMQKDRLTQLDYPDNLSKIIQTGLRNKDTHILDKYLWCLAKYRAFLNELFNSANDDNSLKEACGIQFTTDDIFNLSLQFHKDIFTILLNCLETIDFDNNNCCICLKIHHQIVEIEKWLKLNETKGETP